MKQLPIDLNERQHIMFLIGAQEGNVAEMMACWKLMDKLRLDPSEEARISLRVDGGTMSWSMPTDVEPRAFELEDAEVERLKKLLSSWPKFRPVDSVWVHGFLRKLD